MPKDNITPAIEEAMALEEVSTRILLEVYLNKNIIPSSSSLLLSEQSFIHSETISGQQYLVLKFVADETTDLTIGSKIYKAMDFSRTNLESSQDGKIEVLNIQMTNKDTGFASQLAIIGRFLNNQPAKILEYFPDFPSEPPAYFFSGKLNNLKMTVSEFQFDIERVLGSYDSECPYMTYSPSCPYIFKGADNRCGYTGSATICDKTLSTCETFGNSTRFGGHPSIPKEMIK